VFEKDNELKQKENSINDANNKLNLEKQKAKTGQETSQTKMKELQGKIDTNEKEKEERENDCSNGDPNNVERCCPCIGDAGKNSWCYVSASGKPLVDTCKSYIGKGVSQASIF
jgi:hypothetical protein